MRIKRTKKLASLGVSIVLVAAATGGAALAVNENPLITPTDPEKSATMPERISKRKANLKVQLNTEQQQKLKVKCSASQSKIHTLKTKDAVLADKRRQLYTDLATRLNDLVGGLKGRGADINQLAAAQKQFNDAINQYLVDAVAYKAAVDDVVAMDCAADPAGFQSTLTAARQLRAQLAADAAKIKAARQPLIKAMNDVKQALSSAAPTDKKAAQ